VQLQLWTSCARPAAPVHVTLLQPTTPLNPSIHPPPPKQGFYVFIRALQLLKSHNEGVVLVRGPRRLFVGLVGWVVVRLI
jgi:hypothetical protein